MSSAVCATSASQTVMPSRPAGAAASSSVWPKPGRAAPTRTASASACTRRFGLSCGCASSQATTAPCARCSRRHCASSEVLPKPAGACTRTTGWSRRPRAGSSRERITRWRGTRGGVTLSNRSSAGRVPGSCVEVVTGFNLPWREGHGQAGRSSNAWGMLPRTRHVAKTAIPPFADRSACVAGFYIFRIVFVSPILFAGVCPCTAI